MAIGDAFKGLGQRLGRGLVQVGGYDPRQQVSAQEAARRRNIGLEALQRSFGKSAAILSGDPQRLALAQQQEEAARKRKLREDFLAKNPQYAQTLRALEAGIPAGMLSGAKQKREIREDVRGRQRFTDTGELVFPDVKEPIKTSAVSDPLRTITKGGKVVKNVRDSELTDEAITKINQAGQVIQPLGFTEKFESSQDVDFEPIKSKYLATENIIIKTSELAEKFVNEPSSALAVGNLAQFVDGVIQNIDVGGDLLSGAKDKKIYKYVQKTSKTIGGRDFGDAIKQASIASGVSESRIRDLAYLFAAARGQEGRGLSDKDFENALKIVSGGVGAEGRSAVLKDVSNSLREEFYRDVNFDIATSENEAYVKKLQDLPQLSYYIDPYQQQPSPSATKDQVKRIRVKI